MSSLHLPQGVPSYTHVFRVTFGYDEEKISMLSVVSVAMRVPAVVTPEPDDKTSGYWLEVRDAAGKLLYHRPLHDPMRRDIEVFGDAPGDPIHRKPARHKSGTFEILVPDLPGAARLTLHGPSLKERSEARHSQELVGHDMEELRRQAASTARGKSKPSEGGKP